MSAEIELTVAKFKGDRGGAFSFTFDDGWRGQVYNTLEIINPLEIKGTFFFMPRAMEKNPKAHATWADAKKMQANGHEIGTHDKVKPRLHDLDKAELEKKVTDGYNLIIEKTGVVPVSFALPGGTKLTDTVKEVIHQKHAFIRKPNTFKDEADVVPYGNLPKRKWSHEKEAANIVEAIKNGRWRIAVVHAIVKGYTPFPSKGAFREHCEWIKMQEENLWIAPMGTVGRYILARRSAEIKVISHKGGVLAFSVSVPEDLRAVCTEPLSIIIPIKASIVALTVSDNADISVSNDRTIVDVVPNGKTVEITYK